VSLILDASATIGGLYPNESTSAIHAVFDRVGKDGAWVPSLWRLEVTNFLNIGISRGRTTLAFRDAALTELAGLSIQVDTDTNHHAWHSTLHPATIHNLTLYDAAYLELALRRGLPLASLDTDLRATAAAQGIEILGQ